MLSFLLALAAQAAAVPDGERRAPPRSFFAAGPVETPAFEAEFVFAPGSGREPPIRGSLVRRGRWLRETYTDESGQSVNWADFGTASSVTAGRDEAGRLQSLQLSRTPAENDYALIRRERTGERDQALGEACTLWRIIGPGDERWQAQRLSCETADGIQLWAGRRDSASGPITRELRLLSLRRRPVAPAEVRPPAGLLRWAEWRDLPPPVPARARRLRGYEIHLGVEPHSSGDRAVIVRQRDDWTYRDTTLGDGRRLLSIYNRAALLAYQAEADGRPIDLRLYRFSAERVRQEDEAGHQPLASQGTERVLGETCVWSRPVGYIVVDSQRDCVTGDGLTLRSVSGHRTITRLVATSLVRRRPPADALQPPEDIFDWRRWGIQPVD